MICRCRGSIPAGVAYLYLCFFWVLSFMVSRPTFFLPRVFQVFLHMSLSCRYMSDARALPPPPALSHTCCSIPPQGSQSKDTAKVIAIRGPEVGFRPGRLAVHKRRLELRLPAQVALWDDDRLRLRGPAPQRGGRGPGELLVASFGDLSFQASTRAALSAPCPSQHLSSRIRMPGLD